MSGLDMYLSELFLELGMELPSAGNQFPALYGGGIFPQLSVHYCWSISQKVSQGWHHFDRVLNIYLVSIAIYLSYLTNLNIFGLW